jgi:protein phosphatase PTC7
LTLQEEVEKKENQKKISQEDINDLSAENSDKFNPNQMSLDMKRHNVQIYPLYILEKAFSRVHAVGSATAMIALINHNELSISNIGDSGFLLIRFKNGEPYCPFKSREQQHAFNIPYQLSQLPTQADLEILRKRGKLTEMAQLKNVLRKKNNVCQDSPENADDYTIPLKDGDIIISATDGVFDNLFQHEILKMV